MTTPADIFHPAADVKESAVKCEHCGGAIRLGDETCVHCFLKEGLQAEREGSAELFESVLAEADVPDTHWRLGNYEVIEEIGRGGMGVIYRARQRHSCRIVAVKRILTHQVNSPETLLRFRREAEAAASLDHPNILPIYEVSESEDGLPFFSMKLATGGSLRAVAPALRTRPNESVRLMAKVARAIAHAHERGILHRDLQPGNILIDGYGEPLVSDFGLAKWLDQESDLTRTLTTFGTPGYIAPEQAEGVQSGPAADIYSLGAILFNLLAGRPPFIGTNALSVVRQAAASPAPKLRSVAPSLSRDLETIVARCLEREPKARYENAAALAEDLERSLEKRPILARPVGAPARVWRWSRRNPVLAGAALACLSLGTMVLWLFSQRSAAPPKIPAPEKSIAVLPFENLSDDKENAYFATGVQDEILSDLAKIADLKVISRTSTRPYEADKPRNSRQIGQELGVAHLLEGSVQRTGNHLRINAQLIDARTDSHLWAQTYDRGVADAFAIQSEIAQTIAGQLQAEISATEKAAVARPPTRDLVANDLYLKAIARFQTPESVSEREAVRLLEQAVARDPRFLRAYCALAWMHLSLYESEDHTPARLQTAIAMIEKAAQLQPDAGEVHLIRARYFARGLRDYDHARVELELARRTLPNDATVYLETALVDVRQGRWTEALRNFERAVELDPRNVYYLTSTADFCSGMRRYSEAVRFGRRALALSPHDNRLRSFLASQPLAERADIRPWRNELNAIVSENPGAAPSISEELWYCAILERDVAAAERALATIPPEGLQDYWAGVSPREWYVGYTARIFDRPETARAAFATARAILEKQLRERPDNGLTWTFLGQVKAALGEKREAIEAGQRACELWPLSREPRWGLRTLRRLAMIYAWVGEKDLALQQLSLYAGQPSFVDYGELKLSPDWDPLRGDPRFEKIVASLAPKL